MQAMNIPGVFRNAASVDTTYSQSKTID